MAPARGIGDIYVLVVEDNRPMRVLLRGLLGAVGVKNVIEAETAEAGMQALSGPVDLVLLDWQMQPVDGLAFARMVRWSPASPRPYVPIVMLTAHTEIWRVAAARDAGVNGFVKKPISAQLLLDRISTALTDTRMFVRCQNFIGPDRRRMFAPDYGGPFRRESDRMGGCTFDLDDLPLSA
jgi:CheY-like chemotaxis protein